MQIVYGDETLSCSSVFEWFQRLKGGREDLQDDARSERPSPYRNADTVADVHEMVTPHCRLTLRMMSDKLKHK